MTTDKEQLNKTGSGSDLDESRHITSLATPDLDQQLDARDSTPLRASPAPSVHASDSARTGCPSPLTAETARRRPLGLPEGCCAHCAHAVAGGAAALPLLRQPSRQLAH